MSEAYVLQQALHLIPATLFSRVFLFVISVEKTPKQLPNPPPARTHSFIDWREKCLSFRWWTVVSNSFPVIWSNVTWPFAHWSSSNFPDRRVHSRRPQHLSETSTWDFHASPISHGEVSLSDQQTRKAREKCASGRVFFFYNSFSNSPRILRPL